MSATLSSASPSVIAKVFTESSASVGSASLDAQSPECHQQGGTKTFPATRPCAQQYLLVREHDLLIGPFAYLVSCFPLLRPGGPRPEIGLLCPELVYV